MGEMTMTDPEPGQSVWQELETPTLDGIPEFYAGVLGWSFEESDGGGLFRSGGDVVAGARLVDGAPDTRATWRVYLHTDSLEASLAYVAANGGRVEDPAVPLLIDRVEGAAVLDAFGAPLGLVHMPGGVGAPNRLADGRMMLVDAMTPDLEVAKSFCDGLFPDSSRTHEEDELWVYRGSSDAALFGINRLTDEELAYIRPHWLAWFGTPDADRSGEAATAAGGRLLTVADFIYGHWVVVQDPAGGKLKALQAKVQQL